MRADDPGGGVSGRGDVVETVRITPLDCGAFRLDCRFLGRRVWQRTEAPPTGAERRSWGNPLWVWHQWSWRIVVDQYGEPETTAQLIYWRDTAEMIVRGIRRLFQAAALVAWAAAKRRRV